MVITAVTTDQCLSMSDASMSDAVAIDDVGCFVGVHFQDGPTSIAYNEAEYVCANNLSELIQNYSSVLIQIDLHEELYHHTVAVSQYRPGGFAFLITVNSSFSVPQ